MNPEELQSDGVVASRDESGSSNRDSLDLPSASRTPESNGSPHLDPVAHATTRGRSQNLDPRSSWASRDPRSSSTQSLRPSRSASRTGKRTLLMIYIHGFMGNESSFQSFPAHVHNLVSIMLAESHVVHTKIYPRYKSRRAIEFARDDLSTWLTPHESPRTDVILLGHSMGGMLSAETVLLPSNPSTGGLFRHRILGTVNLDTPFLGMHPGIIVSGISSLFRPTEGPPPTTDEVDALDPNQGEAVRRPGSSGDVADAVNRSSSTSVAESPPGSITSGDDAGTTPLSAVSSVSIATDQYRFPTITPTTSGSLYNPPFSNDVRLPVRTGWNNAMHFLSKHSDHLTKATRQYVMSHLEFGGALADYPGLIRRYSKIRELEDAKEKMQRVRFVNYYTASTGRPKKSKAAGLRERPSRTPSPLRTPRISIESVDGPFGEMILSSDTDASDQEGRDVTAEIPGSDPQMMDENVTTQPATSSAIASIPPIPLPPSLPDLSTIALTKEGLKAAEKEQAQAMKAYKTAMKERSKALKDLTKQFEREEKRRRKVQKDKPSAPLALPSPALLPPPPSSPPPPPPPPRPGSAPGSASGFSRPPTPRDRKFCLLPRGQPDPTWVRVYMEGVDEVGAHCGLFLASSPSYEGLVGDVGTRVAEWVHEACGTTSDVEGVGGDDIAAS